MEAYVVLFISFLIAVVLAIVVPNVSYLVNKILKVEKFPEKLEPYECGIPRTQPLKGHYFSIFHILALVFLLFDLETAFLFPWAVNLRGLGTFGIVEVFVFVFILLLGFFYALAKGALKWE
jgi:NADH-quinone oxidoreductase subunit A